MSDSEFRQRLKTWDIWTILGEPWLDSWADQETRAAYREELQSRGISGSNLLKHRLVAAGGYWWNIFFGNWGALTYANLIHGWILNVSLALAFVAGYWFHPLIGVLLFFICGRFAYSLAMRFAKRRQAG